MYETAYLRTIGFITSSVTRAYATTPIKTMIALSISCQFPLGSSYIPLYKYKMLFSTVTNVYKTVYAKIKFLYLSFFIALLLQKFKFVYLIIK